MYAILFGDLVISYRPYNVKFGHLLFLNLSYFHVKNVLCLIISPIEVSLKPTSID